jgi:hypothetical protein
MTDESHLWVSEMIQDEMQCSSFRAGCFLLQSESLLCKLSESRARERVGSLELSQRSKQRKTATKPYLHYIEMLFSELGVVILVM